VEEVLQMKQLIPMPERKTGIAPTPESPENSPGKPPSFRERIALERRRIEDPERSL